MTFVIKRWWKRFPVTTCGAWSSKRIFDILQNPNSWLLRGVIAPSPFLDQLPSQPPPLSEIPRFLEIQDVPTFNRRIRKTKVLNGSFN